MTISNVAATPRQITAAGNGVTTEFPFDFKIFAASDLVVRVLDDSTGESEVQTLTTDYSVDGVAANTGGTVTFVTAPASGYTVEITAHTPATQPTSFRNQGRFLEESHENALDRVTALVQQVKRQLGRALQMPDRFEGEDPVDWSTLFSLANRKGKFPYFNETTGAPEMATGAIAGTVLSISIIGSLLYPQTAAEAAVSADIVNPWYAPCHALRYGTGTVAVQTAIDVASEEGNGTIADLCGSVFTVDTLTFDAENFKIKNGTLVASSDIPVNGAILLSMASHATNTALLAGIYTGVLPPPALRSAVPGSFEYVGIENVRFVGATNAVKGVWFTGFSRGCYLTKCSFSGCDDHSICINGSWSFSLTYNDCFGDGAAMLGIGIGLGQTSMGVNNGGESVVNAVTLTGNEVRRHNIGLKYDFGSGADIGGCIFELNAADGVRSQSAKAVNFCGNYVESNGVNGMRLGGTNGTDFCVGWVVKANIFNHQTSAEHILLQGCQWCEFGPNSYSTSGASPQLRHYYINSGIGQYISDCDILIPNVTSTYCGNAGTELRTGQNRVHNGTGTRFRVTQNGNYTTTCVDFVRDIVKESGASGETITIAAQSAVGCRRGSMLRVLNNGGGTLTVSVTDDTLRIAGGSDGSRTIADKGVFEAELILATADGDASNTWLASGIGVT